MTDIRYYLYYAWQVTEGAVPHRDLFALKTQLASFAGSLLYALGEGLGFTPLFVIRGGYLLIGAAGGSGAETGGAGSGSGARGGSSSSGAGGSAEAAAASGSVVEDAWPVVGVTEGAAGIRT